MLADPAIAISWGLTWTESPMLLDRHADAERMLMRLERDDNLQAQAGFLVYPQCDPSPFPSLVRAMQRENIQRPPPVALPFACHAAGNAR